MSMKYSVAVRPLEAVFPYLYVNSRYFLHKLKFWHRKAVYISNRIFRKGISVWQTQIGLSVALFLNQPKSQLNKKEVPVHQK